MSQPDRQAQRKIAAQLQRVLIVEPIPAGARLMGDLLRQLDGKLIHVESSAKSALAAAASIDPQIIFTELSGPDFDGLALVRALRRSRLACRKAPIIVVTSGATTATITASRDAGVHEFLRKPFNLGDLMKRLEAVALRSRPWIEALDYIGPDRRRFNSAEYQGERKRGTDQRQPTAATRTRQALQILNSAIDAIESDPMQALRAMQAQAAELQAVALSTKNLELGQATFKLNQTLKLAALDGRLSRVELEAHAKALGLFMPAQRSVENASARMI